MIVLCNISGICHLMIGFPENAALQPDRLYLGTTFGQQALFQVHVGGSQTIPITAKV